MKWIKDLNLRPKAIQLSEESIGQKLGLTLDLVKTVDMTLEAQAIKEKIDKLDFVKKLKICVTKLDTSKVKREFKEVDKSICKSIIW